MMKMKKLINLLSVSVVLLLLVAGCQDNKMNSQGQASYENSDQLVAETKKLITEISIDDFKKTYEGDEYFVLIDVRTEKEYKAGYIPGAVSIERGVLEFRIAKQEIWDELGMYIPEKTDLVVICCKSGNRSALATKALMELGYTNVKSLQGGWEAWHAAYPEKIEKIEVVTSAGEASAPKASSGGGC